MEHISDSKIVRSWIQQLCNPFLKTTVLTKLHINMTRIYYLKMTYLKIQNVQLKNQVAGYKNCKYTITNNFPMLQ